MAVLTRGRHVRRHGRVGRSPVAVPPHRTSGRPRVGAVPQPLRPFAGLVQLQDEEHGDDGEHDARDEFEDDRVEPHVEVVEEVVDAVDQVVVAVHIFAPGHNVNADVSNRLTLEFLDR